MTLLFINITNCHLLWCRVRRPKYPSKSPLFLGSLPGYEPCLCFLRVGDRTGSEGRLAFGLAVEYLLSPTLSRGEVVLPSRCLLACNSNKNCPTCIVDGFSVFCPISTVGIIHKWGNPKICLRTTAHAGPIDALPPTTRWCWCPNMCRHPRGHFDLLSRQQAHPCRWHQSPLTTNRGAWCHRRP